MASITAGLTLLGLVAGGIFYVEERYAKQWHLVQVEQRLDYKIAADKLYGTQQRLWSLQDRYGPKCERGDQKVVDVCRDLETQAEELRRELDQKKQRP